MQPKEEVVLDESALGKGQIELFDWEDHLYESWRGKKQEKEAREPRT